MHSSLYIIGLFSEEGSTNLPILSPYFLTPTPTVGEQKIKWPENLAQILKNTSE